MTTASEQMCRCGGPEFKHPNEPGPETCYLCVVLHNLDRAEAQIEGLRADLARVTEERDAALRALEQQVFGALVLQDDPEGEVPPPLMKLVASCRDGTVEMAALSVLTPVVAAWLVQMLEDSGGRNLVSFDINRGKEAAAEVTIRWASGETSEKLRVKEKERADRAEAERDRMAALCRRFCCDCDTPKPMERIFDSREVGEVCESCGLPVVVATAELANRDARIRAEARAEALEEASQEIERQGRQVGRSGMLAAVEVCRALANGKDGEG